VSASIKSIIADIQKGWEEWAKHEAEEIARKQGMWDDYLAQLKQQEHEEIKRLWQSKGITPKFFHETWDTWVIETPEQKRAIESVKQAWDRNLFIIGGNGTGKTHLAMCLTKEGATYCLVPELFRTVRENMDREQEVIDEYGNCKLLILDEIGRQKGTDFERNLLFEIIDKRWNNVLPTTIIGNIGQKEFADLCGTAILDRLRPEVIRFEWESKRGGKL
jgi:DNA replication protein DnaC